MKYKTYNEITKLFDVNVMNKTQINSLSNDSSILVLTPRKNVIFSSKRSRKQRNVKAPAWFQFFVDKEFKPLVKKADTLRKDFEHVVEVNNLTR